MIRLLGQLDERAVGQWIASHDLRLITDFRIVAKGARIQTFINGQPVADLSHEGIYASHPKGHLGLQVHGIKKGDGPYDVAWRNLRIRAL